MRKFDHAHKYGWYDYLYEFTGKRIDVVLTIALILIAVFFILATK